MLRFWLLVTFLASTIGGGRASLGCKDDETEILTPYYFKDGVKESFCADIFAESVPDYDNEDYRNECRLQLGLTDTPDTVSFSQSARCVRKANGTATYRMRLCCPGTTSKTICYSCEDVAASKDWAFGEYHTQACNVLGKDAVGPITCSAGEVCYTKVGKYRKVTKGCMSAISCSQMEANNNSTCKGGPDPYCVQCCENTNQGICNADHYTTNIPYLYTPSPPRPKPPTTSACSPNPCYRSGRCTIDDTRSTGYRCACRSMYTGDRCQYDACSFDPCQNGGRCIKDSSLSPAYYRCACRLPYDGMNCTQKARAISSEDSTNCKHGSTRYQLENGQWSCLCAPGFIGTNCDIPVKTCLPENGMKRSYDRTRDNYIKTMTCQEAYNTDFFYNKYKRSYLSTCRSEMDSLYPGSRYIDGTNGIAVEFNMQVEMKSCEKAEDPSTSWVTTEFCCNPCLSNPCSVTGYCVEVDGEAMCICRNGYGGKTCDIRTSIVRSRCEHEGNVKEIGDSWVSDDCKQKFTCQECTSCTRPIGEIVIETAGCGDQQICSSGVCHDVTTPKVTTPAGPVCYDCDTHNPCEDGNVGKFFCVTGEPGSYLQCGHAKMCYKMPCPGGLVWNAQAKVCDVPTPEDLPPSPTCKYDCRSNNPCLGVAHGYFCSSVGPDKFIQCGPLGSCYSMACAAPLVWDAKAVTCNWP